MLLETLIPKFKIVYKYSQTGNITQNNTRKPKRLPKTLRINPKSYSNNTPKPKIILKTLPTNPKYYSKHYHQTQDITQNINHKPKILLNTLLANSK